MSRTIGESMKRFLMIFVLCVPLIAQVGRYELKRIPFLHWTLDLYKSDVHSQNDTITVIFDTMTGDMYEIYKEYIDTSDSTTIYRETNYIKELINFKERSVKSDTLKGPRPRSSDIEGPTLSQIMAIEELWRRYKANPVILNDEQVAEMKELRKRWGLVEPEKP